MSQFEDYLERLSPETRSQVSDFYGYNGSQGNPYAALAYKRYTPDPRGFPGDEMFADITRAQTADYRNRFVPVENFLAGQITATGTQSLQGDLDRTRSSIIGAGANVSGQQGRSMERFGVANNMGAANQNSTVSALVGGLNDTRMRDQDRRSQIMSGTGGSLAQKARG